MTRIFFDGRDLEVAIRAGGIERVYPLASLAAVLRVDTAHLRARIGALLAAAHELSTGPEVLSSPVIPNASGMLEGEPTEGMVQPSTQKEYLTHHHQDQPSHGSDMVERASVLALSAEDLATALGADANPVALAAVIRGVPVPVVREALAQALAVPSIRLRASRAALFTAIVRRLGGMHVTSTKHA